MSLDVSISLTEGQVQFLREVIGEIDDQPVTNESLVGYLEQLLNDAIAVRVKEEITRREPDYVKAAERQARARLERWRRESGNLFQRKGI